MSDKLRDRLADIVVQYTGLPRDQVLGDGAFTDLGCDSLDVVEIGLLVESALDIDLKDKAAGKNLPRNLSELEQSVLACLPTTPA